LLLTEEDLKHEIGMGCLGHRKLCYSLIQKLKCKNVTPVDTAEDAPKTNMQTVALGNQLRFVDSQNGNTTSPIAGIEKMQIKSLQDSLQPIESKNMVVYLDRFLVGAKLWAEKNPSIYDNIMSKDQAMALYLYTQEWKFDPEQSLYYVLNQKLRKEDRNELKPFFPFLKLLLSSLECLPKYVER
jgi:hypothetical protein